MQARILDVDTALLTPRTVVRRFREGDGPAFYELLRENTTRLSEHFPLLTQEISDKEQGEFFVRRCLANWLLQQEFDFGLWDHDSARLIGMLRLWRIDWQVPKADVDFFIDQHFAGKGLMTEALQTVIHFAFDQLVLEKLYLSTPMDNYAGQRLARKCSFRREGDLRDGYRRPGGELIDLMLFGLARTEYQKL